MINKKNNPIFATLEIAKSQITKTTTRTLKTKLKNSETE